MFEEILPNLYRIEVPLPGSPLKALNSYVIKGARR
ncbi:MAG: MBL fold metallo-hydrolase, partial [Chloroflexi bacterium CG08_land_8_20_14_0_20_45_12]